jgi:hypothetical protein
MSLFVVTLIVLCGLMFAVYAYFVVPAEPVVRPQRPTCPVSAPGGTGPVVWRTWTYVR